MATNLATILVGLGYDLSALERGAPDAFRLIQNQTMGMSSEMKRASREGAESWRLIDEALGIHISRPLTRIVTQEFPNFAKAMQSLLGAGVVGALGVAGIEFFDKVAKKIEEARAAQEHFAEASRNLDQTIASVVGGIDRKILELTSTDHALRIQLEGADQAKSGIDQIAKALDSVQAAQEKANNAWTRLEAGAGDFLSHTGEGLVSLVDLLSTLNTGKSPGLHDALFGSQALSNMKDALSDMRDNFEEALSADKFKGTHEALELAKRDIQVATDYLHDMQRAGDAAGTALAEAAKKYYESSLQVETATAKLVGIQTSAQRQKEALEAQHEAVRELQGDLKRWNDGANEGWQTWMKINAEIETATAKLSESVLAEQGSQFARAQKIFFPEMARVLPPPGAPMLSDQVELQNVQGDPSESWKKAGEILQQIETPIEKYTAGLQMLKILQDEGRLSADQFALAQQKLAEALQASQDRMQKLLREGGAAGGAQAFAMQWAGDTSKGSTGQFTFDLLNKGLQGFEDEAVKAATGAKTSFRQFFESLDQMALKFLLNKELAGLFKMFSDSSFGKSIGLGNLFGAANPAQIAQTTALTANTAAITALTATMTAVGASGAAGGAGKSLFDLGIPAFAGGTDYAPGGMSLVGENGPELLNLPAGASVTPNAALRGPGNTTVHFHIDAKGAEIGVEEKIARAISTAAPAIVTRAVVEAGERQRRSLT